MQNDQRKPIPAGVRFVTGLVIGIAAFTISTFFIRPNIIIPIIGMLLAAEIAHLDSPRGHAVMGGLIGCIFGGFYALTQFIIEDFTLIEKIQMGFLVALAGGFFYGVIGFFLGKLLKKFRESRGFFL